MTYQITDHGDYLLISGEDRNVHIDEFNSGLAIGAIRQLMREIDKLSAENAELRRDAERYRWIRGNGELPKGTWTVYDGRVLLVGSIDFDSGIDAAMAKEEW